MSILSHPKEPSNPNWALLSFPTNVVALQDDHRAWLTAHVLEPARSGRRVWAHVRGLASHLGSAQRNLVLSQQRAESVVAFLLGDTAVSPDRITGLDWRGEQWATGGARDDSPQNRAAEVIVSFSAPARVIAPAPARPPRMVARRVRCTLASAPRSTGGVGRQPGEAAFNAAQQWRESQNVRFRLHWETRNVPDNQRIVAIELGTTTYTSLNTTATIPFAAFTWGTGGGDTVRITEGGRTEIVDRTLAARIYNHPERTLEAMENNMFGASGSVGAWLRIGS